LSVAELVGVTGADAVADGSLDDDGLFGGGQLGLNPSRMVVQWDQDRELRAVSTKVRALTSSMLPIRSDTDPRRRR